MSKRNALRLFLLAILTLSFSIPAFAGANIVIMNNDGPGEGFNDPAPAAPVGGNPGTTKGQQRLIAFNHAASIWGAALDSNQTIIVRAAFNPLAANVLGSAGATFVFSDFPNLEGHPGPEFADTWYGSALADKRAGLELNSTPGTADINAQFNSNFDFYLGLDSNHGVRVDLVVVLLHELGHGLNFQNFVNEATGANLGGRTDIYARHSLDITTGQTWDQMTQDQRRASAIRFGRVVWDGANVSDGVPQVLSFGSPEVRLLTPASLAGTYQFGTAAFGPPIGSPGFTGEVVAAQDASDAAGAATTDACSALTNAAAVAGKIALIERGTCTFGRKTLNAQNAGAIGVIIYNNVANAGAGPPGMGADGTIPSSSFTITAVSFSRADGLAVAGALPNVTARISVDLSLRAGADAFGRARLFMPFPVQGGSSGSHYDSNARRNLLMEPAINGDLTQSLTPPEDLSLALLRDVGWFADADLDGIASEIDNCPTVPNVDQRDNEGDRIGDVCDPDDDNDSVLDVNDNCPLTWNTDQANYDGDSQGDVCDPDDDNDGVLDVNDAEPKSDLRPTVIIQGCDSGSPNLLMANGATISDRSTHIARASKNHGDYVSTFGDWLNELKKSGLLTGAQKGAIQSCAAQSSLP